MIFCQRNLIISGFDDKKARIIAHGQRPFTVFIGLYHLLAVGNAHVGNAQLAGLFLTVFIEVVVDRADGGSLGKNGLMNTHKQA